MTTADAMQHILGQHAGVYRTTASPERQALETELHQAFARHEQLKPLFAELASLLVRHAAASYVAFASAAAESRVIPMVSHGEMDTDQASPVWQAFQAACVSAVSRSDVCVGKLQQSAHGCVVAAPIFAPGGQPFVLGAVINTPPGQLASQVAAIDQVATATSHWRTAQVLARLDWESRTSSASIELVTRIERCDGVRAACYLIVDELKQYFQCDLVALGLVRGKGFGVTLEAISGMSSFDRQSESVVALQNALDEVLVRNQPTAWPPLEADHRHATLGHRKLIESSRAEAVISVPMAVPNETPCAALVVLGRRTTLHRIQTLHAMDAMGSHLASALKTRRLLEPTRWQRLQKSWWNPAAGTSRRWLLTATILAAFALPACPYPHRVRQSCIVEPVLRRYLVAPYDGILQTSLVRPGDLVQEGSVLARMDDRELRWELSSTIAERGRAAKQRDVAMAENDRSAMQLASLEMERLDLKIKLLKHREGGLEIAAPIGGVVLKGDLDDAEGAPVKMGQALFEVAPLERVKLELSIADHELSYVAVGMTVTGRLDGNIEAPIQGRIDKIFPQSEIRDGKNIFVAEVRIENPQLTLRPGMSGHVRIASGVRPLGWIWFHKAWHRIRSWIG